MEKQRKVDGGGMETIIEQTLGHIQGGHATAFVYQPVEHELVLAGAVDGQKIQVLEALFNIVGVESGQRPHPSKPFGTHCEYICQSLYIHCIISQP